MAPMAPKLPTDRIVHRLLDTLDRGNALRSRDDRFEESRGHFVSDKSFFVTLFSHLPSLKLYRNARAAFEFVTV